MKEGWNKRLQMRLERWRTRAKRIESVPNCFLNPTGPLLTDSLPLMFPSFYSCFSHDRSQEAFLEKPLGIDFLCALGQQSFCVLSAAAVLQPLGTEEGREGQHLGRMRVGVQQKVKLARRKIHR